MYVIFDTIQLALKMKTQLYQSYTVLIIQPYSIFVIKKLSNISLSMLQMWIICTLYVTTRIELLKHFTQHDIKFSTALQ